VKAVVPLRVEEALREVLSEFTPLKLRSSLAEKVREGVSSAVKSFKREVTEFITEMIEPQLASYLTYLVLKYGEKGFHKRVDEDFDLVEDLYENHFDEYVDCVKKARRMRRYILWDSEKFVEEACRVLTSLGIFVREKDFNWMIRQAEALKMEIYGDHPIERRF